jgi:predicted nucleic acid-binding protein
VPRYLADASALARLHRTDVLARIGPLVLAGEVATCRLGDLDLLTAAETADAHAALRADCDALPHVPVDDDAIGRAVAVQGELAARSQHRAVPVAALVIAAVAERAGLVLLHDDDRLALIASVTGQPAESVV